MASLMAYTFQAIIQKVQTGRIVTVQRMDLNGASKMEMKRSMKRTCGRS